MRMVNLFQCHNFSLDCLALHRVIQFCLLVYFDRVFAHICFVVADINSGVSSLPNWLSNLVIVKDTMVFSFKFLTSVGSAELPLDTQGR